MRGLPYQGNHDYCLSLPNFVEIRDGTSNEWRWKCVKDLAGALGSYWYDFGNLVLERMVNMTKIKLEVGKRYPTRNGGVAKIINAGPKGVYEMVYEGDNGCFYPHLGSGGWAAYKLNHIAYYPLNEHNIIGPAIEESEPQKLKDILPPNAGSLGFIDPRERAIEQGWYIAGEKNMGSPLSHEDNQKAWEEFKKRQHVWQGGYVDPTTEKSSEVESVGNSDELNPGDVLTDKEGREWEVADLSEDPESIGWLYLKPKPKRLMGSIRIYRDTNGYDIYVGERATAVRDDWTHIATINLSDFEEGHGL